ncbi:MAG TPA: hypothetical protein VJ370_00540, partial [Streptosporangiaceae bacterium]|nr:hypothetical protein [Streptosporangiaceae bacterium]
MTVRYNDAPTTSRSTPGSVSEMAEPPREDSRAVAVKNSAITASRLNGSIKPTSTISFAQSTGSRDGTTASVARIIPVAYSRRRKIFTWRRSTASHAAACAWSRPAPTCSTASGSAASAAGVMPAISFAPPIRSSSPPAPGRSP